MVTGNVARTGNDKLTRISIEQVSRSHRRPKFPFSLSKNGEQQPHTLRFLIRK